MGKKTPKDLSICLRTFQKITKDQWFRMCEREDVPAVGGAGTKMTAEELRALRLARFAQPIDKGDAV
jgi:hypothetical protein